LFVSVFQFVQPPGKRRNDVHIKIWTERVVISSDQAKTSINTIYAKSQGQMKESLLVLVVSLLVCPGAGFRRPDTPSYNMNRLVTRGGESITTLFPGQENARSAVTTTSAEYTSFTVLYSHPPVDRSQHPHHHHYNASHNTQKFKNFEEALASYEEPMMVIFTAVNCGPCKLMKQELKRVNALMDDQKFRLFAVDTEKFPHIGSRFEISALPCLLLVHHGEPLLRIEGVLKAEELLERVRTITTLL